MPLLLLPLLLLQVLRLRLVEAERQTLALRLKAREHPSCAQ
jgi:hypothetical protein